MCRKPEYILCFAASCLPLSIPLSLGSASAYQAPTAFWCVFKIGRDYIWTRSGDSREYNDGTHLFTAPGKHEVAKHQQLCHDLEEASTLRKSLLSL